ncbi:hypothetical protein GCM10010503_41170 [Streptomyces lucensis JCM 4490]|uniref:Uncharacterized protein n=1 Tax=Streptomyces lucensis JCM 4490 TaxID=1306176 RepID=A0A918MRL4_9ACTN|nr:hypothetical protein GCM10010503_41170 [Streptomyces lucensis JCM 4490]
MQARARRGRFLALRHEEAYRRTAAEQFWPDCPYRRASADPRTAANRKRRGEAGGSPHPAPATSPSYAAAGCS